MSKLRLNLIFIDVFSYSTLAYFFRLEVNLWNRLSWLRLPKLLSLLSSPLSFVLSVSTALHEVTKRLLFVSWWRIFLLTKFLRQLWVTQNFEVRQNFTLRFFFYWLIFDGQYLLFLGWLKFSLHFWKLYYHSLSGL